MMLVITSMCVFSQTNYERYKALYQSYGWNIGNEQHADLVQGGTAYTYMNFSSGNSYSVVACSNDNDVTDVDAFIYLSDGSLFMKDANTSCISIISFSCTWTQQVKIVIKNYASRTPNYASRIRYFIAWK